MIMEDWIERTKKLGFDAAVTDPGKRISREDICAMCLGAGDCRICGLCAISRKSYACYFHTEVSQCFIASTSYA